ncbi:MAG: AmmeMemoRadiSam system radical SAM enzyme [candidate division Zixibacteria bacterium]|nr:AmmeMemoRadiSam system radical SAM enzyme [candidate division Zixibacteria bacterium]
MNWKTKSRIASHWRINEKRDKVECTLCPRHCRLKPNQFGFCGVRGNVSNQQHTFNYGYAVPVTVEVIETEAIYHFRPGSRVLCVGNIGCMLECDFCQNWQTSQVKHLDRKNIRFYSPEDIVDLAIKNGTDIISWTYNDPVVWHEFVLDTARLASGKGIKNLYKSSLYIEIEPLKELIEVIDIFSVSFKSMSSEFYRKYTKGRLDPILEAIKVLGASPSLHLELSQLVVTGLNDDGMDAKNTARWIIRNIGSHVPLHFVGFHQAYKYTKAKRTPLNKLLELSDLAIKEGIEYSYIGNVCKRNISDTICRTCGSKLVERYGVTANVAGLDGESRCLNCSTKSPIREPFYSVNMEAKTGSFEPLQEFSYMWDDNTNGIHIASASDLSDQIGIRIQRLPDCQTDVYRMSPNLGRITVNKKAESELGIRIGVDSNDRVNIFPLLDRAHYPVE